MNKKVLVPALAIILLAIMVSTPVYAFKVQVHPRITKIPFTYKEYSTGPTSAFTLDGTLVSEFATICSKFDTAKGIGHEVGKYVDTYTDGVIGTGVIEGFYVSKITVADGSVGSSSNYGYGCSDKYSSIIEISTSSWTPTTIPFETVVLTVTGIFIVQE